ncbi:MBL fold metallo-hydrolase [Halorubellus sp. JP-L1]|uniref:MBL fold metallo-hydrolase n=1 Tax=Halorubellus sp. JP-L1 TaxID=2715753 RepID=UPI001407E9AF|nr:MBL fold metallo-hydrolase [Halorubellus sp. JP-L1]NHN43017.1 MBL fold metallo-hydrolase [Halorubellus sp. JP-L1]
MGGERTRVERVAVTTPEYDAPEGGNSAWVLPEDGVVVDPGPPGDVPWEQLTEGLADAGLALADVEHVVLTHWHVDHVGLAPRLADAADATVAMHERDAPLVGDYARERERRVERDAATLARWGVPDEHVASVRGADSRTPFPDEFPVTALAGGDRVGSLSVLATPGHTAGHAAFVVVESDADGERAGNGDTGRAIVGDAALRTVTPNVGGGDTRLDDPLAAYRGTLDALAARADRALPGHGTAFDLDERVAEIRTHHRERAGNVRDALVALDGDAADDAGDDRSSADGATPWAVAEACFGEMAGYHVKFGAGEAFAHLRDLTALDIAECVGSDPLRYAPANDGGDVGADDGDADAAARLDDAWYVDEN